MRTLPARRKRPLAGFTLVELMVTIIVATILISIAVPSYRNQLRKSRRTEAKTALLDLASREERFLSTNGAYTNDAGKLGFSSSSQTLFQMNVGSNYYFVNVCVGNPNIPTTCTNAQAAGPGPTYLLVAIPVTTGPQAGDACGTFTLDNTGAQGAQTSNCW
jgi:type IV pilus assembly protein PilE